MSIITISRNIKYIIVLLSIALLLPTQTQAQVGIHADLNKDKAVNVSDVSYLIGLVLGRNDDAAVANGICPNGLHPHIIDLGLPSDTKWACCNVGALNPLDGGNLYAWGETITKEFYKKQNCHFNDVANLEADIVGTLYDVATVKWGRKYHTPSKDAFEELRENCTYSWTTINDVEGMLFTAANGNKVFFPAIPYKNDEEGAYQDTHIRGNYWSSTSYVQSNASNQTPYGYVFNVIRNGRSGVTTLENYYGMAVRPAKGGLCPDAKHPHLVDLGLPSSTKWACCNLGADKPIDYGKYYAWGETEAKEEFNASNYLYPSVSLGDDIAGTDYDAATANWGNGYCMPSMAQFQELFDNCTATWTTIGDVNGMLFVAANGNSIFLPAADRYWWNSSTPTLGWAGFYWSSNQNPYDSSNALFCEFNSNDYYLEDTDTQRCYGLTIRPVSKELSE